MHTTPQIIRVEANEAYLTRVILYTEIDSTKTLHPQPTCIASYSAPNLKTEIPPSFPMSKYFFLN